MLTAEISEYAENSEKTMKLNSLTGLIIGVLILKDGIKRVVNKFKE